MMDAAAKADEIRLKEEEIQSRERLAGMNSQIKVIEDGKNRALKEKETAVKTGVDMAFKRAQLLKGKQTKE